MFDCKNLRNRYAAPFCTAEPGAPSEGTQACPKGADTAPTHRTTRPLINSMKKIVFLTAAIATLLPFTPAAQASPEKTKKAQVQIIEMCKNKDIRIMLLHELTCTPERKLETVKKLQEDPEFREMYDHNLDRR